MNRKKILLLGLFTCILFMNLSVTRIWASDDDLDGLDDDYEQRNLRQIEIDFSDEQFEVESLLKNGNVIDDIEFTVTFDNEGLSVGISYGSDYKGEGLTEFELDFRISFRKLIEYVDIDDNGIFSESVDKIIQEVLINNFKPINYSIIDINQNAKLHYIIVSTSNGIFTAHFYFPEDFIRHNDTIITPTQTKVDIEITNFNYLNASSKLALYVELESESNYRENAETEDEALGFAYNEESVSVGTNGFSGFFSWKLNATVDNTVKQIYFSPIGIDDDDENEQKIYINYPRGTHIYHDPKIGVEGILKSILTPPFPLGLIIMIIALIALTLTVSYTLYRYREKIFPIILSNDKKYLNKPHKKQEIIFSPKITAISEDFMKVVNQFEWEEADKEDFIREMMALSPSERQSILKEMLEKSK